jgi:TolB-like protein
MDALEAIGDRAGALQHAAVHQQLLRDEFGANPDPAVAERAERLRASPAPIALGPLPSSKRPEAGAGEFGSPATAPLAGRRSWALPTAAAAAVIVLALVAGAMANVLGPGAMDVRRIAVLPLANLTGDPQQEYFVAGMHDALVTELAQIDGLVLYSRQSVLRYQGSDLPLPAIARELGVDALVEGSVFRSGDSVRVTVQLVRAQPEEHLWAGSHYGPVSEALAHQGQVARSKVLALAQPPTPSLSVAA